MSKNNSRRITLVRGPIWGIHYLTLIISCFSTFPCPTSELQSSHFSIYNLTFWIKRVKYTSKRRSLDFRLTSVAQKRNRELKQRRFWATCVNRKFIFVLLARFYAQTMSYKALILAFTTWLFEWKGCNTHQRGEVFTSGLLYFCPPQPRLGAIERFHSRDKICISSWQLTSSAILVGVLLELTNSWDILYDILTFLAKKFNFCHLGSLPHYRMWQ